MYCQDVSFLLLDILQSSFSGLLRLCIFFFWDQTGKAGLNCIEFIKITKKKTGPGLSARLKLCSIRTLIKEYDTCQDFDPLLDTEAKQ